MPDPVFKKTDDTWWFSNETWSDELGPFADYVDASRACTIYAKCHLEGTPIEFFRDTYDFLSNFYAVRQPEGIEYGGLFFPTVEHAFQAAKCTDLAVRRAFTTGTQMSAATAKREGRALRLRPDWEAMKIGVMRELLEKKFADPTLRRWLLLTTNVPIEEGNTWGDAFWGVVHAKVGGAKGGENHLGRLLVQLRGELKW